MNWRRARIPALWILCLALASLVVARARYITDLSAFLPANPTPAQQLLVDQLRDGPASRLILIAVEHGDADARARASVALAARLRRDARFSSVNNGEPLTAERDREFLFQHRYLLSDQVAAQRFSAPGLRAAMQDTIDDLASPAGLMLKSLLPNDPTGEMLHIIEQLARTPAPAAGGGVWVSPDGARTLMVVQTAAGGSDIDAQEQAVEAIRSAFAAALLESAAGNAQSLQLKVSGPGVFAVAARAKIERAAVRLSLASAILVVTLLFAVYRSVPALALGLMPVASGAVIGIAAVALGFGAVHGITLGFGTTLIGESVDYSIYFFVQSRRLAQDPAPGSNWQQTWWPTIRLGMLTSVCGFASLLPSGFPGLAQLGAYSISGLIAAACVTRYVLPALLPAGFAIRDVAPFGRRIGALLRPMRQLRGGALAAAAAVLAAAAIAILLRHDATLWNRELSALSPVSAQDQDADTQLRRDLGAADVRDLVIVSGSTLDAALAGAERAARALEPLVDAGMISGFDSPANFLPSAAAQAARRDSLPGAAQLRDNLRQAAADLGVNEDRLQPFLNDVEAARHAPLLTAPDLQGTSMRTGFEALILHQRNGWHALLPLHSAAAHSIDTARVTAALQSARIPQAQTLDLKQEADSLYAGYLSEAIHLSLAGIVALTILLLIALRSPLRVAKVLAPLALAVLCVAAGLALSGVQLTILHLVGMLLIVAVGSNYALFFDRQSRVHAGSESVTLASLAIANLSTVIGFGLLSFSQVPVLVALGATVAPGAFLALLFAAVFARA
ncbi:MAG TPA: MMPL family transporter [Steroidobacteraceae bacterium]|jgi:predicted exporter|nr:MMPL family transporter [Steroidobacteraceae bacterium]